MCGASTFPNTGDGTRSPQRLYAGDHGWHHAPHLARHGRGCVYASATHLEEGLLRPRGQPGDPSFALEGTPSLPEARLGSQRCLELILSPFDRVVELHAALRELGHHHSIYRLVVDLRTNFRARRRPSD